MSCPTCGGDTRVVDSRWQTQVVRRRRECLRCHLRFTTYEMAVETETQAAWARRGRALMTTAGGAEEDGKNGN